MNTRTSVAIFLLLLSAAAGTLCPVAAQERYQKPPQPILDVLNAPPFPVPYLSPPRDALLLLRGDPYPPISDLAEPMLRLAGIRLNPNTNGPHRAPYWTSLSYLAIPSGAERPVPLPPGARIGFPQWSAEGTRFAFPRFTSEGIELWVADAASLAPCRVEGVRINAALSPGFVWLGDSRTLLVHMVPPGRGPAPPLSAPPDGPSIQEASGKHGVGSTYEARDVLRTAQDEERFDYYATSQLAFVDAATGAVVSIGKPDLYSRVSHAPDGKHFLVERIHRPYSHLHTYDRFPREIEIWDRSGATIRTVASLPLADEVPIHGVRTGPRDVQWRATAPATLVWTEALDGGDPMAKVPHRDRLLTWSAPFEEEPREMLRLRHRAVAIWWGESGSDAIAAEFEREHRWERAFWIRPDEPEAAPVLIWDLSVNEKYKDPGFPSFKTTATGHQVFEQDGEWIWLSGAGSTPQGDRPFLDRFDLRTRETEQLFRCDTASFETYSGLLDRRRGVFLTRRESPRDPPNFYIRTLGGRVRGAGAGEAQRASTLHALTRFPDPAPQLRGIEKRIVTYARADGVPLSFTLYLPPGYRKGTRLPTVVWAYPLEYSDPETAGQVSGSECRFTQIAGTSPLFFLLSGYAVLYNATMPVIAHPDSVYDRFVDQLVAGANAAVEKAVALGVTDPDRVGIVGHSHGGRMAATLLAHSDLFRAGIARSGAYNQTLVPFGFQGERRTFFQVPDVYVGVSAFRYADRIRAPLLLIHGELDANPGTMPLQSELMYRAVVGTGGTARLVVLPFESHGYEARESVEHTLWEMASWFDRWVKSPRPLGQRSERSDGP